ncbi:MAG: hypothetical protein RIC16_10545 [Rhodospirillales bacterium]
MSGKPIVSRDAFKALPHAVTLLGMSGVGKTVLSSGLRKSGGWFHYSADYRIGTRYLAEDIIDNIKYKIMQMDDGFVANLLRSDSIYINHNISVENLEPVSTFLGMFGDAAKGGLDKPTFLERQGLYRDAEIASMIEVSRFIAKARRIYGCTNFVNDASGSLVEIADPGDANDPVVEALRAETLVLYLEADDAYEQEILARAKAHPKPMFYNPDFIGPRIESQPDDGNGVDPVKFARPLFPDLLAFRKPRYRQFAENFGFTIPARQIFDIVDVRSRNVDADAFLDQVYDAVTHAASASGDAADNLGRYVDICERRRRDAEAD